jgi:uncharacterized UBP type Zn finger protein
MKLEINFMNNKLITEIKKNETPIKVKDLLQDIKLFLKTNDNNFILFDEDQYRLKESDIIKPKKKDKIILYLMKSSCKVNNVDDKNSLNENSNLNKLIKECTGAKKEIEKKQNYSFNQQNRINFIEFLDNRNGNDPLGRLMDLFVELNENNMIQIRIGNDHNTNPIEPVEADENLLSNLLSMGFPENRARQALINSRNNINRATEMLLGE